jgi:small conductance mechanosensitive channel
MDFSLAWERIRAMVENTIAALPNIGLGLIVLLFFFLLARSIRSLVYRATQHRRKARNLGLVLGRLAQWAVLVVGLLVALTIMIPNFTPTNLVSALGIGSIAIGFAFKDIFQNFLAGLLILLTEPFRIDDQIIYNEFEGTVEDIQTRATSIRTYDGRRVVIPNAELFTNAVMVNTAFASRRLQYDVGIGYGDDIDRARELIVQAIRSVEGVLSDPKPDALVVDLAESSVNIRARWWVEPPRRADVLDVQDRVLTAIKTSLLANGIDLPFPTRQILFHDQTEDTDGDRSRQREGWPTGKGQAPKPRGIAETLRTLASTHNGDGERSHG